MQAQTTATNTKPKPSVTPRQKKNEVAVVEHGATLARVSPTPMEILQEAVTKGVSVEMLDKLMMLQERYENNEARKAFVVALAKFKANAPEIMKNKKAGFDSKRTGEKVGYAYATLDQVCAAVLPALSQCGLSHTWEVDQQTAGTIKVTCVLRHEMGHSESVNLQAAPDMSGAKNSIQAIGSTVSYLQRYTLLAATGLAATETDDDASAGDEPRPTREHFEHTAQDWGEAIPVPKNKAGAADWGAFAKLLIVKIESATTLTMLDAILMQNKAALEKCDGPKAMKAIEKALEAKRLAFVPGELTVVDLDHVKRVYPMATLLTVVDTISELFFEAAKRSKEQVEAMWEANSAAVGLIRAVRPQEAETLHMDYLEALKRATSPAPDPNDPKAQASDKKGKPADVSRETSASHRPIVFSPFEPGGKSGDSAWIAWAAWFRNEVKASEVGTIHALAVRYKRELDYVRGFLPAEADAIDAALDAKRP